MPKSNGPFTATGHKYFGMEIVFLGKHLLVLNEYVHVYVDLIT